MNILILSAGTRNKIVQYFKRAVGTEGKVIATDCSNLAPAVYEADRFYLVPEFRLRIIWSRFWISVRRRGFMAFFP